MAQMTHPIDPPIQLTFDESIFTGYEIRLEGGEDGEDIAIASWLVPDGEGGMRKRTLRTSHISAFAGTQAVFNLTKVLLP